jgi:hypothetical protein
MKTLKSKIIEKLGIQDINHMTPEEIVVYLSNRIPTMIRHFENKKGLVYSVYYHETKKFDSEKIELKSLKNVSLDEAYKKMKEIHQMEDQQEKEFLYGRKKQNENTNKKQTRERNYF